MLAGPLLAMGMLVLVAGAGPAEATFPGKNGKIAFVKDNYRQSTSGIFTINPDGSAESRLRSGSSPSWSADGHKVVFERFGGDDGDFDLDIYVTNAGGGGLRQVTSGSAYDHSPSFFPDGQKIAFIRDSPRHGTDIFTINLDGTQLSKLTNSATFYEESLAVSPDGEKIAYSRYNMSSDIFVMNSDGTDTQNLTKTGRVDEFGPDWSPDAQKIAFTSYRFNFVEAGEAAEGEAFAPEALAREAQASQEPEVSAEISVMNADGTERRDLTSGPAFDVYPAFSPNGAKIAFIRATFSRRSERSDIFVMRANGARKKQLTDTRAFEWGPDWQPIPRTGATPE